MEGLVGLAFVAVIAVLVIRAIFHVVPQYQRLVVFAFGKFQGTYGPGLVVLLPPPFQSVAQTIDLREFVVEIPQQTCITQDNAPIAVDFLIYQRIMEESAKDSFLNIQNFRQAINGIAQTTLRSVIGNIPLDDVLSKRENINEALRIKLDEITHRWGMKVTNVEIKEIIPPRDIQDAMNRQMSAERNRRAAILEAEGKKQSAILVAEGDKQSNILQAEGARQAAILRAEGFGIALDKINDAAGHADARTMTLQYLDALKQIGASPSTKFVIPTEFTTLLQPLIGMTQRAGEPAGGDGKGRAG
jgi:regulator of protease activity HflC (stomatin/prohibitin superfamily)